MVFHVDEKHLTSVLPWIRHWQLLYYVYLRVLLWIVRFKHFPRILFHYIIRSIRIVKIVVVDIMSVYTAVTKRQMRYCAENEKYK